MLAQVDMVEPIHGKVRGRVLADDALQVVGQMAEDARPRRNEVRVRHARCVFNMIIRKKA